MCIGHSAINPTNSCAGFICLFLNIFMPGTGTMLNSFFGVTCCEGFFYGLLQSFDTFIGIFLGHYLLAIFGWFWSFFYGIEIMKRSGSHYNDLINRLN